MFNPLRKLFTYTDVIHFNVSGDAANAVERLARSASTPILQATLSKKRPTLVGRVSRDDVRLHKGTPLFGNIFKPVFFGTFRTDGHRTSLVGRFRMGMVAQLIVWFSVIMGVATQVIALPSVVTTPGVVALSHLEPMLFIAIGILIVLSGKLVGKRDILWIKQQIESAL